MKTQSYKRVGTSKKRAKEMRQYKKLRLKFLEANPLCQRCEKQGRTRMATCVHHWAGRRSNYLKAETWRASCDKCNLWAKDHPREAREEGWIAPEGVYKC